MDVIDYLSGKYISLEDRHVYAKIWYDETTGMIGRRGKLGRVIYMTNIGTIPEEVRVIVKVGDQTVGFIEESFLERMRPGDIFTLGGNVYEFRFSRGMVAQVRASPNRPPTIPSWFSEMLPLSYDLALDIGKFRKLLGQKFCYNKSKEEILKFIDEYVYVDKNAALSLYNYFYEQYNYASIPSNSRIVVEHYTDERGFRYVIFHSLFGRRVNDCLSRGVGFAIGRTQHKDVEIGINDNGFYICTTGKVDVMKAFKMLKSKDLRKVMEMAIDKTEVLKRRFRHCATRALMILRTYKGRKKRVGRQQVSSMILLSAVRRISQHFSILKEARREVLEDLMDIENAGEVLKGIESKKIKVEESHSSLPSPFALNLITQGHTDIMKIEDKMEFLKRMHNQILAKISVKNR
jgi:ATP-dependent Lhr-like helicase